MTGYGQFCPVAAASEVFVQRWTPLILRELFAGSTRFNEIQRGLPLISRTLLAQRLRALEQLGILDCVNRPGSGRAEYRLTAAGAAFAPVVRGLGEWGQRWAARFDSQNLDPRFLMWNIRRRLALERLPANRLVMRFEFSGLPARYRRPSEFWLIVAGAAVDLCMKDPGAEVDLQVSADMKSFARMWLGDISFAQLQKLGGIRLAGRREYTRAFPTWLRRSGFADVPGPRAVLTSST